MTPVRFAVDRMLGRLVTWLRLIGQDATYGAHLSGRALLRHASSEQRIVLTRDRRLLHRSPVPLLLVESHHFRDQLRQVVAAYDLDPFAHIFTRCIRCNDRVVPVAKAEVRGAVPAYVFESQQRFVRCPRCRRLYWPATHYARVRDELHAMSFRDDPL